MLNRLSEIRNQSCFLGALALIQLSLELGQVVCDEPPQVGLVADLDPSLRVLGAVSRWKSIIQNSRFSLFLLRRLLSDNIRLVSHHESEFDSSTILFLLLLLLLLIEWTLVPTLSIVKNDGCLPEVFLVDRLRAERTLLPASLPLEVKVLQDASIAEEMAAFRGPRGHHKGC